MGGSMIKRTFLILAFLAGLLSPVYAAGTISLSLTQRLDNVTWKPLNGGKLYFFRAGTTTPQNAYQDSALTIPHPNPLTLDSGGNIPQLFFADGQIKFRLTNASGVNQLAADNILVVGSSSGGGGGGTVDPTTIIATGDIKARYGTGTLTGFVRANGRTIGSSTSGATERANSDCQALFEYLWGTDANLVVSTGRGASANADWVANKTIALPDFRGKVIAGMDDMGNTSAGLINSMNSTTLGAAGGEQKHTLLAAELAAHTHANTLTDPGHTHPFTAAVISNNVLGWGGGPNGSTQSNGTFSTASATTGITINNVSAGSSTPFNVIQPTIVMTYYQKL